MAAGCTLLQIGRCVVAWSALTTISTLTAVAFAAITVTRTFFAVAVVVAIGGDITTWLLLSVLIGIALRYVVVTCSLWSRLRYGRCGLAVGFLAACVRRVLVVLALWALRTILTL